MALPFLNSVPVDWPPELIRLLSVGTTTRKLLSGLDLSGTTHTNAGVHDADAWTFSDVTGNYNDTGGTVTDSIAKADATISVAPYSGLTVDFCQQVGAKVIIRGLRVFSDFEHEFRMAHANKRLAPEIEYMMLITAEEHTFLSSSIVREIASLNGDVSSMVPAHVMDALDHHFHNSNDEEKSDYFTSLRD